MVSVDLGSHSVWNCNYSAGGLTVITPNVLICFHKNLQHGCCKGVLSFTLKEGDQYLGHVMSGSNCSNSAFTISVPYFDLAINDE